MTWRDYRLIMQGVKLREVDEDYRAHQTAYLTMLASAEKSAGKGKRKKVYGTFKKFFDYDAAIKKITDKTKKKDKPSRFAALTKHLKEKQTDGD